MTATDDVTVAVEIAERDVLRLARDLSTRASLLRVSQSTCFDPHATAPCVGELLEAIEALVAADEAEAAEIAAHEAEMQQRIADHEVWLDEMEDAAGAHDWYAEYEADLAERAHCERRGRLS